MDKIIEVLEQGLSQHLLEIEGKFKDLDILKRRIKDKEKEIAQLTLDIGSYEKAIKALKDNNA